MHVHIVLYINVHVPGHIGYGKSKRLLVELYFYSTVPIQGQVTLALV